MTVSEKEVVAALRARNAAALVAHLAATDLSDIDIEKLAGILMRFGPLLPKYPDHAAEAFRGELFARLADYAIQVDKKELADQLAGVLDTLVLCQEGYRRLLDVMPKLPAYVLPPAVRVWGLLRIAEAEFNHVEARIQAKVAALGHIPSRILIDSEGDRPRDADAASTGLVEVLTMNLLMEARNNHWTGPDDLVVLPPEPELTEEDVNASAGALLLASLWRRWEQTEERRRFLGGHLSVVEPSTRPEGLPPRITRLIRYEPASSLELVDFVSNARLTERIGQTYFQMLQRTSLSGKASGIDGPRALPPSNLISTHEGHSGVLLSEWLSLGITGDHARYGDLRLVEWLRGYSTLQCLAHGPKTEGRLCVRYPRHELVSLLQRLGLKGSAADIFLDRASLRKGSPDLFDQPLVRCADGSLLLFVAAVSGAVPARQVMSSLAALRIQVDKKGKLFEAEVVKLFKDRGMNAASFKAKCLGQDYEFDALVEWDDYVFLFECKNYSLSASRPQQTFHFGQSLRSHAKQTSRLALACAEHPELLTKALGAQAAGKTVVPCVVNAMAYSFPEGIDGVYFTDLSALSRFFERRQLHHPRTAPVNGSGQGVPAVPIHAQWAGDSPTAEDLLKQLRNPIQFKLLASSVELRADSFELDQTTLAWISEYTRGEPASPTGSA